MSDSFEYLCQRNSDMTSFIREENTIKNQMELCIGLRVFVVSVPSGGTFEEAKMNKILLIGKGETSKWMGEREKRSEEGK